MSKHTPVPWQCAWDAPDEESLPDGNGEEWAIRTADGQVVVGTTYYDGLHMFVTPEDARFIVLACNSHDELVKALVVAKDHFLAIRYGIDAGYGHSFISERVGLALRDIGAALAKARDQEANDA